MDAALVSQLLKQLLEVRSPEFGARLKQRLNVLLRERQEQPFDEKAFGYRKFTEFLEKSQADWLKIERTGGSSDVTVTLRSSEAAAGAGSLKSTPASFDQAPIRSEVWQAFVNPSRSRKRFLNKETFAVTHFEAREVPAQFREIREQQIEISPLADELHITWMREFLNASSIQGAEREPLDAMLTRPYTSSLNFAFTAALGNRGNAWRHFRTQRITEAIQQWAASNGIPDEQLRKPAGRPVDKATPTKDSSRGKALKLLQLISDEDIERAIVPVLVSTILLRTRT